MITEEVPNDCPLNFTATQPPTSLEEAHTIILQKFHVGEIKICIYICMYFKCAFKLDAAGSSGHKALVSSMTQGQSDEPQIRPSYNNYCNI